MDYQKATCIDHHIDLGVQSGPRTFDDPFSTAAARPSVITLLHHARETRMRLGIHEEEGQVGQVNV